MSKSLPPHLCSIEMDNDALCGKPATHLRYSTLPGDDPKNPIGMCDECVTELQIPSDNAYLRKHLRYVPIVSSVAP